MTRFGIEPIYGSTWLVLLATAAVVGLMLWVTPPTANPAHRRRLMWLRGIAGVTLFLAALGPSQIRTDPRTTDATLMVAVDTSRSMTLTDGDGGDRWSTQREVWRTLAGRLQGIDESLRVALLGYDASAAELSESSPGSLDDREPKGDRTDLGGALMAAIRGSEGRPLAGVVLVGDGVDTADPGGPDPQRVAQTLASIGVPLWAVPIGPASDGEESRDVAVEGLPETYDLFAGNELEVAFEVRLRGLAGVDVPVRVSWIDVEGTVEEAATRRATATRAVDTAPLRVPAVVPPPGTYRLVVEAEPQSGELVTENNRQIAFAEVREGGGRVLYLEGEPRFEQLFLRRALGGFPDLDLTYQWIPRDTVDRWPVNLGDWFEPGHFDVYILGDLDAAALGEEQLAALAESVAAGAGLITLGGFQTYGTGGYADSPLAEAMPVRMDAGRRRQPGDRGRGGGAGTDGRGAAGDQIDGPIRPIPARDHPITAIGEDVDAVWRDLPSLTGANLLVGPKAAPGVQVLLETDDEDPLLVIGEYGRGRTAAFAFDSTYRWWRGGRQERHLRFWRQLMLWVLAREDTGDETIRIELDTRRFAPDAEPSFLASVQTFRASLQTSVASTPAADAELVAEVIDEAGRSTPVRVGPRVAADGGASVEGSLPRLDPGFFRLRVRDESADSNRQPAEVAFQVIDDSRELARPMADPMYLAQLAATTGGQGGDTFSPDRIEELIERIAERRQRGETTVVSKSRLGDGPWSGWLLFVLFAAPLSFEWWLRRRWGLA